MGVTPPRVSISPVIPTVAVLLLAALWGLSVFAGWGLEAFCTGGETAEACARRLETVSTFSALFAALAGGAALAAWLLPVRERFMPLMGVAVAGWVVAEAVLFAGGLLSR